MVHSAAHPEGCASRCASKCQLHPVCSCHQSSQRACLQTTNLVKEFPAPHGRHLAVNHLDVQFEPDKMVALLGPSGSGEACCCLMHAPELHAASLG